MLQKLETNNKVILFHVLCFYVNSKKIIILIILITILLSNFFNQGMFIGRRFFPPNQVGFNSGGAGYVLDQVSLQVKFE